MRAGATAFISLVGITFRRGAWAPVVLFVFHLLLQISGIYSRGAWLDMPMHLAGGIAIAWFFRTALVNRESERVFGKITLLTLFTLILTLTALATIFWEFGEYISDYYFGTRTQLRISDTMMDMALGLAGSVLVAAATVWQRNRRARGQSRAETG